MTTTWLLVRSGNASTPRSRNATTPVTTSAAAATSTKPGCLRQQRLLELRPHEERAAGHDAVARREALEDRHAVARRVHGRDAHRRRHEAARRCLDKHDVPAVEMLDGLAGDGERGAVLAGED